MEIRWYHDRDAAIDAIIGEDLDFIVVRHIVSPGEVIKTHFHPEAREWIIIHGGTAKVSIKEDGQIQRRHISATKKAAAICIPKKHKHSLQNGDSATAYLVIRDMADEIIYCEW